VVFGGAAQSRVMAKGWISGQRGDGLV